MTKIHHLTETRRQVAVRDSASAIDHALAPGRHGRGFRLEEETELATSDVHRIAHQGETYDIGPDGSFTVPEHVAAHLVSQPGWHKGPNPLAGEAA
jgi:hypothetical protein